MKPTYRVYDNRTNETLNCNLTEVERGVWVKDDYLENDVSYGSIQIKQLKEGASNA